MSFKKTLSGEPAGHRSLSLSLCRLHETLLARLCRFAPIFVLAHVHVLQRLQAGRHLHHRHHYNIFLTPESVSVPEFKVPPPPLPSSLRFFLFVRL
jgi:hypothetical protein